MIAKEKWFLQKIMNVIAEYVLNSSVLKSEMPCFLTLAIVYIGRINFK